MARPNSRLVPIPVDLFRVNIAQTKTVNGGLEIAMDQIVGINTQNGTIMFIVDANDQTVLDSLTLDYKFNHNHIAAPDAFSFVVPGPIYMRKLGCLMFHVPYWVIVYM